jgi:formyl-CoA transferase
MPAKRAPELGEHNEAVLHELGFSANEIASFRANGTISKPTPQPAAAARKPLVPANA